MTGWYLHELGFMLQAERDGDGFVVFVLELPGCGSQGDTLPEALANVDDANIKHFS